MQHQKYINLQIMSFLSSLFFLLYKLFINEKSLKAHNNNTHNYTPVDLGKVLIFVCKSYNWKKDERKKKPFFLRKKIYQTNKRARIFSWLHLHTHKNKHHHSFKKKKEQVTRILQYLPIYYYYIKNTSLFPVYKLHKRKRFFLSHFVQTTSLVPPHWKPKTAAEKRHIFIPFIIKKKTTTRKTIFFIQIKTSMCSLNT